MELKEWLYQYKNYENAIFEIKYKKDNNDYHLYIKNGKYLIQFINEKEPDFINYIYRLF